MREAVLYEKLPQGRVRCHVCQWRCTINLGRYGVCKMRRNEDGTLFLLNYAEASSVAVDPIEKKPLFHFFPGSKVFSLGTWGCNFHCKHCQNWQISWAEPGQWGWAQQLLPEASIDLAKQHDCTGIAWTYNEPTVWFEYTLDSAKLAKANNLYTVYVTNGYLTPEALDLIGPFLDAYRVDIKGFSDAFYRTLAKVPRLQPVLEMAQRAQGRWGMHVEVVTNVIPTLNDDDAQLEGIATWIRDHLGELTPWHVTRFYPHHQMLHLPPTPIATLERAYKIGRKVGLHFIYLGNVPGHPQENTLCYRCGRRVVQRYGYSTRIEGLQDARCASCGAELNFWRSDRRATRTESASS